MVEREIFQIIKVIDTYQVVINGGSSNGLSEGDEMEVFVTGEQLTDPYNDDELLGTLDYIKVILTIKDVYPRFSVCVNEVEEKVEKTTIGSTASIFGSMYGPKYEWKIKRLRLNVNDNDITGGYPDQEKRLLLGDKVRARYI